MGNRLSIITTRTGDDGTTGLGDGSRINKTNIRIQAIGDVDELNSYIGIITAYIHNIYKNNIFFENLYNKLISIQHDLFNLGGELSMPNGYELISATNILQLDNWIKIDNSNLEKLEEFILPGGDILAAYIHVARSICRRVERSVLQLNDNLTNKLREITWQYLNRLSDWLFIISRCVNKQLGVNDILWQR